MFPMPDLGDDFFHQPKTTAETMHSDSDSDLRNDIFAPAITIEKTSKFHPKPGINNNKNLPMPSKSRASKGPSSTKFRDPADNKWPVEGSSCPSLGFLCSDVSSPAHHVDQDPKGNAECSFSTNVLDEVPQSVAGESKERTDIYCLESLDGDVKSSSSSVKQIGKCRLKPALHLKQGKRAKSVSFILPNNDGESAAFVECQSELVTSSPIMKITSFVKMISDQNMDDSLGSLSTCNRDNQIDLVGLGREDVMDISTLDIHSESVCNSVMAEKHVEKFQSELQDVTKSARANAGNSPRLTDFGSSKLDSLHIGSVATSSASICPVDTVSEYSQLDSLPIHNESLDAHTPSFPVGGLIESLTIKTHSCFPANSFEERACCANTNDLVAQSLTENEDLQAMEGEHTIDHIEEPYLEECVPSILQNEEAGKSSRKVRQRNKKLKASVDNMAITDQNAKNTISEMDDYDGDGYKEDDFLKKKKSKLPRKSRSKSSEHESSIKSRRCKRAKRASEDPCSTIKNPPKKRLLHGSRRCKRANRQVNKALLEIPDDELDRSQLVIKDLIRLAGFKEQISKKKPGTSKNSSANQSEEHKENPNSDVANGGIQKVCPSEEHKQNSDNDVANGGIQKVCPRLNYHSYMRRAHQTRWSKADTEIFYQAIRQFGTDFAMIQVLFPNRSRQQVKAKFKNEQRKHPMQIADALVHRCKDHSHFEKVIQHLQAVAEQKSKNDASDLAAQSQDEADQNEEESIEANSKEEQDVNYFGSDVECSVKSTEWDGNDVDQHSEDSADPENFWI